MMHPTEPVVEFAAGTDRPSDVVVAIWPDDFALAHQSVGHPFLEPPT